MEDKDTFRRVDYEIPLKFAQLAKQLNIPHFGLLTAQGANPTSWFNYMKTKGEVERDIKSLELE